MTFGPRTTFVGSSGQSEATVLVECFRDAIWVAVLEEGAGTHGIITHSIVDEAAVYLKGSGSPVFEAEVLIGCRDDPLANTVVAAIHSELRKRGEQRPLICCVSLQRARARLTGAENKREFVDGAVNAVALLWGSFVHSPS